MRILTLGLFAVTSVATASAQAQTQAPPPGQLAPGAPDRLMRGPYITGTGATVDKPGDPQGSAPTPLDRNIQRQNNKIDNSICKGC